jgi:hypothetical protein
MTLGKPYGPMAGGRSGDDALKLRSHRKCNATVGDENTMTKTTIALAAALFLAVGTAAQAGDLKSHERQAEGFSFHTGPLGQPLGVSQPGSWWADPSRTYDSCRGTKTFGTIVRFGDFELNLTAGLPVRGGASVSSAMQPVVSGASPAVARNRAWGRPPAVMVFRGQN